MHNRLHSVGIFFLSFLFAVSLGQAQEPAQAKKDLRMNEIDQRLAQEAWDKHKEKEKLEKESARQEKKRLSGLKKQVQPVYREAVRLYDSGELEAAQDQFKQVEWILPHYKETERYLVRLQKDLREKPKLTAQRQELKRLQGLYEKASGLYETAKEFYAAKSYDKAKIQFMDVESVYSDFKSTRYYLRKIQNTIQKQRDHEQRKHVLNFQKSLRQEKLAEQAKIEEEELVQYKQQEHFRKIQETKQPSALKPIVKSYKVEPRKEPEAAQEEPKMNLEKESTKIQVNDIFAQAKTLYYQKDYDKARQRFLEVTKLAPDDRGAKKYLARIDEQEQKMKKDEERQKQREKRRLQKEYDRRHRNEAKEIEKTIEQEKENLKKQQAVIQKDFENRLQQLYQRAVNLYQSNFYQEAQELFVEIEKMQPHYQETQQYLAKMKNAAEKQAAIQSHTIKSRKRTVDQTLDFIEKKM